MCWASKRTTTRTEDAAYSLLGLFGENMPLLYGEGKNAFARLQEEIIKISDDQTIFAWGLRNQEDPRRDYFTDGAGLMNLYIGDVSDTSVLAASPRDFANSHKVLNLTRADDDQPYTMTNKGLAIQMPLVRHKIVAPAAGDLQEYFGGVIACRDVQCDWNECLSILLVRYPGSSTYRRVEINGKTSCLPLDPRAASGTETIYISQRDQANRPRFLWSIDYQFLSDQFYQLVAFNGSECDGYVDDHQITRQVLAVPYMPRPIHTVTLIFYKPEIDKGFGVRCRTNGSSDLAKIAISNMIEKPSAEYPGASIRLQNWERCLIFTELLPGQASEEIPRVALQDSVDSEIHLPTFRLKARCSKEELLGKPVFVVEIGDSKDTADGDKADAMSKSSRFYLLGQNKQLEPPD
jgi:hypothetical protein